MKSKIIITSIGLLLLLVSFLIGNCSADDDAIPQPNEAINSKENKENSNNTENEMPKLPGMYSVPKPGINEHGILIMNNETIEDVLNKQAPVLVNFHKNFYPHSKRFSSVLLSAVQQIKNVFPNLLLAEIDAMIFSKAVENIDIFTLPSLVFFRTRETYYDYYGEETKEGILAWVHKKMAGATTKLTSVDDANQLIDNNNVTVIACVKNLNSEEANIFTNTVEYIDNVAYGITDDANLMKYLDCNPTTMILVKNFDDGREDFPSDFQWQEHDIGVFVMTHMKPDVSKFNAHATPRYVHSKVAFRLFLIINEKDKNFKIIMKEFEKVAKQYKDRALSYWIDTTAEENNYFLSKLSLKLNESPKIRATRQIDNYSFSKYKPSKDDQRSLTLDELKQFVASVDEKRAKPYFISETKPVDWDETPVKVIVGDDFQNVAWNKNKLALIYFWADWCITCNETLHNILIPLANEFLDDKSIEFAQTNYRNNEYDGLKDAKFPSLFLFRKNTNEEVRYVGAENYKSIKEFLLSDGNVNVPETNSSDKETDKTDKADKEKEEEAEEDKTKEDKKVQNKEEL